VVELIDNDDIEVGRIDRLNATGVERLNRGEDVIENARLVTTNPELAKGAIA
jgi:hypothetical protein